MPGLQPADDRAGLGIVHWRRIYFRKAEFLEIDLEEQNGLRRRARGNCPLEVPEILPEDKGLPAKAGPQIRNWHPVHRCGGPACQEGCTIRDLLQHGETGHFLVAFAVGHIELQDGGQVQPLDDRKIVFQCEHFELVAAGCQAEIGLVVEGRFCDGLDGIC